MRCHWDCSDHWARLACHACLLPLIVLTPISLPACAIAPAPVQFSFMGSPSVPRRLQTGGVYALLRHPQALGNMLFLIGGLGCACVTRACQRLRARQAFLVSQIGKRPAAMFHAAKQSNSPTNPNHSSKPCRLLHRRRCAVGQPGVLPRLRLLHCHRCEQGLPVLRSGSTHGCRCTCDFAGLVCRRTGPLLIFNTHTHAAAVVPVEERMLKEAFGDQYTRYA